MLTENQEYDLSKAVDLICKANKYYESYGVTKRADLTDSELGKLRHMLDQQESPDSREKIISTVRTWNRQKLEAIKRVAELVQSPLSKLGNTMSLEPHESQEAINETLLGLFSTGGEAIHRPYTWIKAVFTRRTMDLFRRKRKKRSLKVEHLSPEAAESQLCETLPDAIDSDDSVESVLTKVFSNARNRMRAGNQAIVFDQSEEALKDKYGNGSYIFRLEEKNSIKAATGLEIEQIENALYEIRRKIQESFEELYKSPQERE